MVNHPGEKNGNHAHGEKNANWPAPAGIHRAANSAEDERRKTKEYSDGAPPLPEGCGRSNIPTKRKKVHPYPAEPFEPPEQNLLHPVEWNIR
jgi:hypothetical protein